MRVCAFKQESINLNLEQLNCYTALSITATGEHALFLLCQRTAFWLRNRNIKSTSNIARFYDVQNYWSKDFIRWRHHFYNIALEHDFDVYISHGRFKWVLQSSVLRNNQGLLNYLNYVWMTFVRKWCLKYASPFVFQPCSRGWAAAIKTHGCSLMLYLMH